MYAGGVLGGGGCSPFLSFVTSLLDGLNVFVEYFGCTLFVGPTPLSLPAGCTENGGGLEVLASLELCPSLHRPDGRQHGFICFPFGLWVHVRVKLGLFPKPLCVFVLFFARCTPTPLVMNGLYSTQCTARSLRKAM